MATKGSKHPPARARKKVKQKRLRVAPYFVALFVVMAVLWASALATTNFKELPTPRLGLDLQGGLSMTLSAYDPDGGTPDEETIEQARQIIENRVNSTGVTEPEVFVEGSNNIVVNVAGTDTDQEGLRAVGAPAELRFRIVSDSVQDLSDVDPEELAEEGEDALEDEIEDGIEDNGSDDDASENGSNDEATEDEATEDEESTEENGQAEAVSLDEVWDAVGDEAAEAAQSLESFPTDEETLQQLEPFGELSGEEVAALSADLQFWIPAISCEQLDTRPPGSVQDPEEVVTACGSNMGQDGESEFFEKHLLEPADVLGSDVQDADVGTDPANPTRFNVNVSFTSAGAQSWGALTTENVQNQVAIVLDNEVVSAPVIQEPTSTSTSITGEFDSTEANLLADQLNFGSLPSLFTVETVNEVTPTLGVTQLEAGLLAGGLGLLLVFLYCLAYYRVMGFIVLGSLGIATATLYPAVALLGSEIGFTLTLAGMAGFVLAIGITADSFVVFFERIKEEMRDGRSAKSAVPRAWARTRRTVLSANMVSIISAVVLYILAIGPVRGFAFALGMSTLVNIMVVFLFTHPIASFLSRGRLLNSKRLSGLHVKTVDPDLAPSAARR